jgi:hypothetical protein
MRNLSYATQSHTVYFHSLASCCTVILRPHIVAELYLRQEQRRQRSPLTPLQFSKRNATSEAVFQIRFDARAFPRQKTPLPPLRVQTKGLTKRPFQTSSAFALFSKPVGAQKISSDVVFSEQLLSRQDRIKIASSRSGPTSRRLSTNRP